MTMPAKKWEIDDHGTCPRCGAHTVTDGERVWCTFVGGGQEKPCSYGIDAIVMLESKPQEERS